MRSVVIEAVSEGVDERLQLVDAVRQVERGVELVAPGPSGRHPSMLRMPWSLAPSALVALDGTVDPGAFGRQDGECQALVLASLLEGGLELRSAIDLDTLDPERRLGDQLVEERCG